MQGGSHTPVTDCKLHQPPARSTAPAASHGRDPGPLDRLCSRHPYIEPIHEAPTKRDSRRDSRTRTLTPHATIRPDPPPPRFSEEGKHYTAPAVWLFGGRGVAFVLPFFFFFLLLLSGVGTDGARALLLFFLGGGGGGGGNV